jgi:hypothetical protein
MRTGPVEGFWWITRVVWVLEELCKLLLTLLGVFLADANPIRLQRRNPNDQP